MKKAFLLIGLVFSLFSKAQSDIQNNDSVRTMLLTLRMAGGASKFKVLKFLNKNEGSDASYQLRDFDGTSFQIGAKLSSTAKKNTAFTVELNYLVSQFYVKYNWCDCGLGSQTNYSSDYKTISHSFQLAILPRISIGKKHLFYTSFGPFINTPFYRTNKGIMTVSNSSFSSYTYTEYTDNEIKNSLRPNFGTIINIGADYKLKENVLSFELRFQSNFYSIFLNNTLLLCVSYTLNQRPLHIPFYSN